MVRGKIQMKRIENEKSRQITFSKRRNGLMKKAYELSVLCDAEVDLIIFSQKGRLCEFTSSNMQKTIERYRKCVEEVQNNYPKHAETYMEQLKHEATTMAKQIEILDVSQRKLLGQDLGSCSVEELQEIETQLKSSLGNIRARKEKILLQENARLHEKSAMKSKQAAAKVKEIMTNRSQRSPSSEVVTKLFIGLPEIYL